VEVVVGGAVDHLEVVVEEVDHPEEDHPEEVVEDHLAEPPDWDKRVEEPS